MADNTNKVTIDADFFAQLYAEANSRAEAVLTINEIAKERDELKAKLESREKSLSQATLGEFNRLREENETLKAKLDCADVDRETYKDRAEAAERCIDDIANNLNCLTGWENKHKIIEDAIRAYRERKEAK